ncbi:MAG TPA: proprotein convertase P-domain-containing protein [Thermoanaerobaculia bacterium]|nr:proprotein convertase P-domain-containing protein [Thermoanaerobaculia bacterium]HUM30085.1 proprotein convertase P-domain-containing protein [Thermoanaerobaculia bacterium]HXK68782.1 proprotein convertase P-domain-containing protein [Thermoanaerobaculia bacterium]
MRSCRLFWIYLILVVGMPIICTASSAPLVIGEHIRDTILETPHPYPGSESGKTVPVWEDTYTHPGAAYLVFEFRTFDLAPGDYLEISDGNGKIFQILEGKGFLDQGGDFISKMVQGKQAVLTLYSSNKEQEHYGYRVERITRGYNDQELDRMYGMQSICGIDDKKDAICYESSEPDVYEKARAVARIVMDGSSLCTAWLVSCEDHIITNNHCTWDDSDFDTQGELNRMEFQFMYQDPTCGGSGATWEYSFMGGTWLENNHNLDYTLIQAPVSEDPAATYGWLHIDYRLADIGELMYIVGHPSGRPKEISLESTASQDDPDDRCHVTSQTEPVCVGGSVPEIGYYCDTEGGNSGSPVLSYGSNKIIALHHCGTCANRGVRIQNIWDTNQAGSHPLPSCSINDEIGKVELDAESYTCNDTIGISVYDGSLVGAGTQNVTIWSDTESTPETVSLMETPADSGNFSGTIPSVSLVPVNGNGELSVSDGDTVTVQYIDASDGQGGTNIPRVDTAAIDCLSPIISNVHSDNVTGNSADILWDTNENADSVVHYGLTPPTWATETDADFVTSHTLFLTGLTECSTYYYRVESSDSAGNTAYDDNGGSYFTFQTGKNVNPTIPSTDVPKAISDNVTVTSRIDVPDTKEILDINVLINITHTYDGDLDIFLIAPDSTRVELSTDNGVGGDNYIDTIFDQEAANSITTGAAPFTGSFRPEGDLSRLYTMMANGTWTLEVSDDGTGDSGTLTGWSLIFTFPGSACGPHAAYSTHALVTDSCTGTGGSVDGIWDAGEQVQFSLTVENNGTVDLTNVTATVTSNTTGMTMIDGSASFGAIARGATGLSQGDHVTVQLPSGAPCADVVDFSIEITSDLGTTWTDTFSQTIGEILFGGGSLLNEDFEGSWGPAGDNPPAGWTIEDHGSIPGTWNNNDWYNYAKGGSYGAVVRVYYSPVEDQDEWLISPAFDIPAAATSVDLEYDHYFYVFSAPGEDGYVDFISDQTTTWTELAHYSATTGTSSVYAHALIDLMDYAGETNCQVRFRYVSNNGWYWEVDNVAVNYTAPEGCNMNACTPGSTGPTPIPDGSGGSTAVMVSKTDPTGSQLTVSWDDMCSPAEADLVMGPLSSIASYTVSGWQCTLDNPHTWEIGSTTNVWFVLVGTDGAGTESTWGTATGGPRNGTTISGVCSNSARENSGTCP